MTSEGYLALLLHAHLPFVRHPEHACFLEESWLFQALTESYLPLLQVFERLLADRVRYRVTLSLSPTLLAMLRDPFLQRRYVDHLQRQILLAERECVRRRGDRRLQGLAEYYLRLFRGTLATYQDRYRADPVSAFAELQREGVLEIITTAATHAYLPLLRSEPAAARAQLGVAADVYRETFGRPSPGVWLPECGYYPGLEEPVRAAGFGYFVLDAHGVLGAKPQPRQGVHGAIACSNGVAVFGRDPDAAREVWDAQVGFPADAAYREFHWDLNRELPRRTLAEIFPESAGLMPTGIKYYRVTGQANGKALYEPALANRRAEQHAGQFLRQRLQAARDRAILACPPLLLAPYDAELFGHWWFEGPHWLEALIRQLGRAPCLELLTPGEYLERHGTPEQAMPAASSWGENGYNESWLNGTNSWIYPHLHQAVQDMRALVSAHRQPSDDGLVLRALRQAARSLLLAEASDWAFILRTGAAEEYARGRIRDQLARFRFLRDGLRGARLEERRLRALEQMDNLFPGLDLRLFA